MLRARWERVRGPSCPWKEGVITGCLFLLPVGGGACRGGNPAVSAHINGLIGLFSRSQNEGLSLADTLSPSEPPPLKDPANA